MYEKMVDKKFSEAERQQLNKQEEARNKFFQKLNKIQETNDLKQKKLQEFMEQDPKELRSRIDEVNYLKSIEVAQKRNQVKDIESKSKKESDQISNYRSLAQQLQERQLKDENIKMQENAIANYYMKEADKYRQEVEEDKRRKQKLKEEYNKALADQINENKKKKQYSVIMSEHERRVNDKDIKAYEYNDTKNLYAKVVGFGGDNRLDKYIDKSMSVNKSAQNSPNMSTHKANGLDTSIDHGSNLARMGQMSLQPTENILTDGSEPPRIPNDNPYPMMKLQKVRENMEKQDAIKYRANTMNRGYGFDQSIKREGPIVSKSILQRDENNPYEYNFVAPGNY